MKKEILLNKYAQHKEEIQNRLQQFKQLPSSQYFSELLFCLLTPQSKAQRCWEAVEEIKKLQEFTKPSITAILKTRARFHNNKASYVIEARKSWPIIVARLENPNSNELRNWLAENIQGLGLKEAGHFLRNIGKSNNQIAILDRHILSNLHELSIIPEKDLVIKGTRHYLELEQQFLSFSHQIGIPIDELDLLFWSQETGEIFK